MKISDLKFVVVYFLFYLEFNLAQILKWKSLIDKALDGREDQTFMNIDKPKPLIIFIVDKTFLRSSGIRNTIKNKINYALEPYKSFLTFDGREVRSKDEIKSRDFKRRMKKDKRGIYKDDDYSPVGNVLDAVKFTKEDKKEVRDDVINNNDSEEDLIVDVVSDNLNIKERREEGVDDGNFSEEVLGGLKLTKKQAEMLRRTWRSSCNKRAVRQCKRACRNTYKSVCREYRCHRSQKRSFKRQCATNCKRRFN